MNTCLNAKDMNAMTGIYISLFSLLVALISFWLSYRNRIERMKNENYSCYLETNITLSKCEYVMSQAENNFREFWRLAYSHALLKVPDYDEIIDRIRGTKSNIKIMQAELENIKNEPEKVKEMLVTTMGMHANGESFMASIQEDLRYLQKEIDITSDMEGNEKIEKLRQAISHIKQWKKF